MPGPVTDDLMDIDNHPSGLTDSEASRFDTGIDQTPLSGPVVAHGAVAVDVPAFIPFGQSTSACIAANALSMSRALKASDAFASRSRSTVHTPTIPAS